MHSAIALLTQHLELGNPELTTFVISSFNHYNNDFLKSHPTALDPTLAQITARVRLTMAHRPVGWLWTQHALEAKRHWGQEEHATDFVLRVLDYLFSAGLLPKECDIGAAVYEVHRRLCVLQSLCLGSRTWIEDAGLARQLRTALVWAMRQR